MKKIIVFFAFASLLFSYFPAVNQTRADNELVPVYSFWINKYNYHFYTASEKEKNALLKRSDVEYEDIAWYAYSEKQDGTLPVYRFKNRKYSYYFYTISESQKKKLSKSSSWKYKGVSFYAYASETENTVPVYIIQNASNKNYIFTSSTGERKCYLNSYPPGKIKDKGEAFWIPKENANVSEDDTSCRAPYGPEISVGLWSYTRSDFKKSYFKIKANKDYVIKDSDNKKIAEIKAGTITRVKYSDDGNLLVYKSIPNKEIKKEVRFEARDGNSQNMVFDIYRPSSPYDQYRGKIKLRYDKNTRNIWVINTLPMEQYVWGMGETTGTGPFEHTKVMTTMFRTYGYWYIKYATKYLKYGFIIRSDSGSQIYRGYDWEKKYPNIKKAAAKTQGRIVKYKSEIALTPYSSWSDGRTRSFEERWGSDDYPWCKSVKDPYGKHPTMSTKQLEAAGNHMVGLIANGSVKLAGSKYKKKYDWILKYYYSKVSISKIY